MKKFLSMALAIVMALSLVACGGSDAASAPQTSQPQQPSSSASAEPAKPADSFP